MIPRKATPARRLAVAAVALAALAACGEVPPRTVVVDRVHDLVARLGEAELSKTSVYNVQPQPAIDSEEDRDRLAYLRNRTGSSLTFDGLETRGPARLTFGCGVAWTRDGVGDEAVIFRVEAKDELVDGEDWTALFAETLAPSQLPRDTRSLPFDVELPARDEARWTLRFSTHRMAKRDADDDSLNWPGWFSPQLRSQGRPVALDDHPVVLTSVTHDLVALLPSAEVVTESDEGAVRAGWLDAALDAAGAGGKRWCVVAPAPSRVAYEIDVPDGASLRFAYGVDQETGWSQPGDGMVFAVTVDGASIWSKPLFAQQLPRHRGWHPAEIDLSRWAGRTVRLELVTQPREDSRHDVGGFAHARITSERRRRRLAADEAPSVFYIVVDTLRADRLGDGDDDSPTPRLDAVAAQGTRFTAARSASSWTWPATGSLLTGLPPNVHGVHDVDRSYLVDELDTVAELFADRGYTTAAFVSNLIVGSADNFHQGFELYAHTPYANARALNERVEAWLDNTEGLARFAYIHYFDPHAPYRPPPGWVAPDAGDGGWVPEEVGLLGRLLDMQRAETVDREAVAEWMASLVPNYDAEVRYFDAAFGELMDALERRGALADAVVAFTSDHGEEFFEHGLASHGSHLYEETLGVPLWITGFGRTVVPTGVCTDPVETRDLVPTLCELASIPLPPHLDGGRSLLGSTRGRSLFGQTWHGYEPDVEGWSEKLSVVRGPWKLIHSPRSGRSELYDLATDPGEKHDVSADHDDVTQTLLEELLTWREETAARGEAMRVGTTARRPAGDDALRMLEELGYVGR